jgi:hypothetical protein
VPFLWRTAVDGAGDARTNANRALDRIIEAIRWLEGSATANSKLVEDQLVGTSPTTIYHNMGRRPRGVVLARQSEFTIIWEPDKTVRTATTLQLQAGASVTVDLLVF